MDASASLAALFFAGIDTSAPVEDAAPAFRITGRPFLPEPMMITFVFGEEASRSVASIPFHSRILSFRPLLTIA
jgi:hypothetical protein